MTSLRLNVKITITKQMRRVKDEAKDKKYGRIIIRVPIF